VGNFRIGRELGAGAFGRVYDATVINPSPELPEHVTLKFVRLDAATPEKYQERVRSLEREALIAIRFDHPNIVKTYNFMDLKGHKCLVMEFVHVPTASPLKRQIVHRRLCGLELGCWRCWNWHGGARVGLHKQEVHHVGAIQEELRATG
jgi:serine/threonine protein kinase